MNKYISKAKQIATNHITLNSAGGGAVAGALSANDGDRLGGAITGAVTSGLGGYGSSLGLARIEHRFPKLPTQLGDGTHGALRTGSGYAGGKLYSHIKSKFKKNE